MPVSAFELSGTVKITGVNEAQIQMKSMGKATEESSSKLKGFLSNAASTAAGLGLFNLAGSAFSFLKDQLTGVFQESLDASNGMAQTVAVLKSTHNASGETADAIADLAGSLSHLTTFSDDTIQAGENMLLTFTNIGKNVFPQATKTVLDMSQALGQDTKSSAIQLGKALNDPITGITALQRVGVTFTDSQKKLITSLVDSGNVAGAQKVILQELQREFGGSAVAAGKTLPGQLTILQQSFADVKQAIGDALLPILQQVVGWVQQNVLPALSRFGDWFVGTGLPAIQHFIAFVQANAIPILIGLGTVVAGIIVPAFIAWAAAMIANPVGLIIVGIGLAVAGLTAAFQHFYTTNAGFKAFIDNVGNGLKQFGAWIQSTALPALQQLGAFFQSRILPILHDIGNFLLQTFQPVWQQLVALWQGQIVPLLGQLWAALQPLLPVLQAIGAIIGVALVLALGILNGVITGIIKAISGVLQGIVTAIGGVIQFITGIVQVVSGVVTFIIDLLTGNFGKLGADLGRIWQGIVNMFQGVWQVIVGVFQGAWGAISGFVSGLVQGVIGFFKNLFDRLVGHSIIPDMINGIIGFFASLPGRIFAFVMSLVVGAIARFNDFKARAISVFQSIVSGIGNVFRGLGGAIWGAIKGALNGAISIINGFISGLNRLHIDVGDVHIGVNIPLIPYLAKGGKIAQGGLAVVGEAGPELVRLPTGAQVIPNTQMAGAVASQRPIIVQAILEVDGRLLAKGILPHMVSEVRARTAVVF